MCRRLVDAGAHVVPVMTDGATRFVGEVTFSALASEPVRRSLWDEPDPIPHTRLGQEADLVLVAPATARLLSAYAAGYSHDLLTNVLLATRAPVMVCPAMHTEMWEHPAVRDNLALLVARGVHVVAPEEGRLAGGDVGAGRLADPATIVAAAAQVLSGGPSARLDGRPVGAGHRWRDTRTDRPRALHRQPLLGQAGTRPRGGGRSAWGDGHPRHHHEPARAGGDRAGASGHCGADAPGGRGPCRLGRRGGHGRRGGRLHAGPRGRGQAQEARRRPGGGARTDRRHPGRPRREQGRPARRWSVSPRRRPTSRDMRPRSWPRSVSTCWSRTTCRRPASVSSTTPTKS